MKTQNNIIQFIAGLLLVAALFSSCKKEYLEIAPRGRLIAENTVDYDLMFNSTALLNLTGTGQVLLGDEVAAIDPFFSSSALRTQRFFRWEAEVYQRDEDALEMTVPNQSLYIYNKIINEVMDSKNGTTEKKLALRAEALAGRAWTNFLLINYYGKPYDAATAATDPGYPLITESDVTLTNFERASVKEVYDFIIQDLTTAINDLPVKVNHRLRMSRPAAQALLGKVYVFMRRYNDALPLFNSAVSALSTSDVPTRFYNYNIAFAPGGSFLPIGLFGPAYPTIPNNEETIYGRQVSIPWTGVSNEIVIHPGTVGLFRSDDLRLRFYRANPFPSGANFPAGLMKRLGPIATPFGVIVPELYLLRAECKARANDLPGAVADVELLRRNRMPEASAPVPAASQATQLALLQFIMQERIREFALMGFRWFDMRRLSIDPLFGQKTFTHELYSASGSVTTFTSTPERLVMQLPQKVIDQNPGMTNNP